MLPKSIKRISLDGVIWGSALDESQRCLYWEVRDEQKQVITLARLQMDRLKLKSKKAAIEWWDRLEGANAGQLYFIRYLDKQDPTRQKLLMLDYERGGMNEIERLPDFTTMA